MGQSVSRSAAASEIDGFYKPQGEFVQCGQYVFFVQQGIRYAVSPQDITHVGAIRTITNCDVLWNFTKPGTQYQLPQSR